MIQVTNDDISTAPIASDMEAYHMECRRKWNQATATLPEGLKHHRCPFVHESASDGVGVELMDRWIDRIDGEFISVDIWEEDRRDVCCHIVPATRRNFSKSEFELIKTQVDRVFAHVFDDLPDVEARGAYFGWSAGERREPMRMSSTDPYLDLFDIRMVRLANVPLGAKKMVECVRLLDHILRGVERAL